MGQVDDFQLGEEAVAQMQEAQEQREREQLHELLNQPPLSDTAELEREARRIPVDEIATGFNIRRELRNIEDLALSIRQRGQRSALEVRPNPDSDAEQPYLLVSGHRRLAALRLLQEASGEEVLARCEVLEGCDEADHFALQMIENDHEELEPKDMARGIRLLMDKYPEWDAKTLARSIGKPESYARRHLRLLDLPAKVREQLESGDLTFTAADLLRKAEKQGKIDEAGVEELAAQVSSGEMSTAELKQTVAPDTDEGENLSSGSEPRELSEHELDPYQAPVADSERGVDPELEAAADALLEGDGSMLDPQDNNPLLETVEAPAGRAPSWSVLDAYLLGRVIKELGGDDLYDRLGISEDPYQWADQLTAGDRASKLREVARLLLVEDDQAPERYLGALED